MGTPCGDKVKIQEIRILDAPVSAFISITLHQNKKVVASQNHPTAKSYVINRIRNP